MLTATATPSWTPPAPTPSHRAFLPPASLHGSSPQSRMTNASSSALTFSSFKVSHPPTHASHLSQHLLPPISTPYNNASLSTSLSLLSHPTTDKIQHTPNPPPPGSRMALRPHSHHPYSKHWDNKNRVTYLVRRRSLTHILFFIWTAGCRMH